MHTVFERVPTWLLRVLPANAASDGKLGERLDKLAAKLHDSLSRIDEALKKVREFREYDAAVNRAAAHVWKVLDQFFAADHAILRGALLNFAREHLVGQAQARVIRRLVKDPSHSLRQQARRLVERSAVREVALPQKRDGVWDATGWLKGTAAGPLSRHPQGKRVQEKHGVPVLKNVRELRKLLGIKSAKQLGFFLLASDAHDGPYTKFTIPKRDGADREICAPKSQLRW